MSLLDWLLKFYILAWLTRTKLYLFRCLFLCKLRRCLNWKKNELYNLVFITHNPKHMGPTEELLFGKIFLVLFSSLKSQKIWVWVMKTRNKILVFSNVWVMSLMLVFSHSIHCNSFFLFLFSFFFMPFFSKFFLFLSFSFLFLSFSSSRLFL